MTTINIIVSPYHNIGTHFFSWSLNFVAGNVENNSECFNGINWHHSKIDSSFGLENTKETIEELSNTSEKFTNLNVILRYLDDISHDLYRKEFKEISVDQRTAVEKANIDDYKKTLRWLQKQNFIPIILDYNNNDISSVIYNDRFAVDWTGKNYSTHDDVVSVYEKAFFADNIYTNDSSIWDRREKLALIYHKKVKVVDSLLSLIDNQLPHLYYTSDDIWNNLDSVLPEILETLNLPFNHDNFVEWKKQYNIWRKVHDYCFSRHFDRIIDSIKHNKYMSLKRFNMNFYKEMLIQQELIKNHNLNFKTWKLEKFPDNTQDLHKLLEPNCHIL